MTQSPATDMHNPRSSSQQGDSDSDVQVPQSFGVAAAAHLREVAIQPSQDVDNRAAISRYAYGGSGNNRKSNSNSNSNNNHGALEGWVKKEQGHGREEWDIRAPPKRKFTSLEVPQEQQQQHRQPAHANANANEQDRDLQEPNWDLLDYVPLQNYDMNSHHHQNQHPQYYAPAPASSSASVAEDATYHHFQPPPQPSPTYAFSPSASTSPYTTQLPPQNFGSPGNPYEALTVQEAELKRLRNTAASARFRAKKKQREASLERNAREKREQLEKLEERIAQLEKENQWLRELILRKGDRIEEGKKKGEERKDGVGTETEAKE